MSQSEPSSWEAMIKESGYQPSARAQNQLTVLDCRHQLEREDLSIKYDKMVRRAVKQYVQQLLRYARATPLVLWRYNSPEMLHDLVLVARRAGVPGVPGGAAVGQNAEEIAASFFPSPPWFTEEMEKLIRLEREELLDRQDGDRFLVNLKDVLAQNLAAQRRSAEEVKAKQTAALLQKYIDELELHRVGPGMQANPEDTPGKAELTKKGSAEDDVPPDSCPGESQPVEDEDSQEQPSDWPAEVTYMGESGDIEVTEEEMQAEGNPEG